ncbi:MAG: universal stress protein [Thermoproteota archaeon]|nr:universal stress protein [Thermoproteota archaeon]MEC9033082.1 universal stress protein [Thermoproteota archaeon]MEC9063095.1 universal stress protein [Thermoproteota archaeon]MEC9073722.1 universal stress protein [Thermoproteota archaeon]MEC9416846.1 universal stress protein [Thermoproteota archaeon]
MSIKQILVPLDGSKNSERGLDMALDLAGNTNRSIVCLYVKPTSVNSVKYGELFNDEENRLMRIAFDFAQKECKKHNVKFIDETVTGDAKSGIVKYANDSSRKIDLLVMGARGRGSVKAAFMGSVSNHVLNKSKIPVLIVK